MSTLQDLKNYSALRSPGAYTRFLSRFYPENAARAASRAGRPLPAARAPELPDLTDPEVQEQVQSANEYLYRLFPVMDTAYNLWVLTQAMLNAVEFSDLGGTSLETVGYRDNFDKWDEFAEKPNYHFRTLGKQVEVAFDTPAYGFSLGLNVLLNQGRITESEQDVLLGKATAIIQKFWPDFKMPTGWSLDARDRWLMQPKWQAPSLVSRRFTPQDFGARNSTFKVPWTPSGAWNKDANNSEDGLPPGFPFNEEYLQLYGGVLEVELELQLEKTVFRSNRFLNAQQSEGEDWDGFSGTFQFRVVPHFYLKLPLVYALWSTHATSMKEFVPAQFVRLMQYHVDLARQSATTVRWQPPARLGNFLRTQAETDAHVAALGMRVKPRVSPDGLAILQDGRIAWVPQVNAIAPYYDMLRNSYDPAESRVTPPSKFPGMQNMPIWTDWVNNKLVYTNDEGEINTLDLLGCIALDEVTIYRMLNTPVTDSRVINFFNLLHGLATPLYAPAPVELDDGNYDREREARRVRNARMQSVNAMFSYLVEHKDADWRLHHVAGLRLTNYEEETRLSRVRSDALRAGVEPPPEAMDANDYETDLLYLAELRRIIGEVWQRADRIATANKMALSTQIIGLRPLLVILSKYPREYDRLRTVYEMQRAANSEDEVDLDTAVVRAPNLPLIGEFNYIPHQGTLLANLDKKEPKSAFFDVQPGGGKTIITLTEMMQLLEKGKAKRPMVIVPGNLVKEFVKEVNTFSKGQINIFPISAHTMPRLLRTFNNDIKALIKYLRAMPINTVFVVNYDFLQSTTDYALRRRSLIMEYGEEQVRRWPSIDFLLQLEPDYIALDESQKVKNEDSGRSRGTLRMMCTADFKRAASGTIISNRPTDLVGQTKMFNPTIFGSVEAFNERFTGGTGIVQPDQERNVLAAIKPYALHAVRKRRQWAHMLPFINEQFYFAELTPHQSAFYEHLINEAKVKMQGDARLRGLMDDSTGAPLSEEDEEKVESALRTYLARVEQFIVAPNSDVQKEESGEHTPGYASWDGDGAGRASAIDLVSPKVAVLVNILRCHFGIGVEQVEDPEVQKVVRLDPKHKIIVFGYHTRVSKHIMDNLPPEFKAMAVHYTAGDDQAIIDFRDRADVKILVADENSLKEGFNLQMASRIVRFQTLWSPGDVEQAVARIMRPDPRGLYNRTEVSHDWILMNKPGARPTVDIAKTGRLISKVIEKARLDNFNDPNWHSGFIEKNKNDLTLPLIRMNLRMIDTFSWSGSEISMLDGRGRWRNVSLKDYFGLYTAYKGWELDEFRRVREEVRARVSRKLGRELTLENDMRLIMRESTVKAEVTSLPGSRPSYVPWVPGGNIHDEFGLSVKGADGVEAGITPLAGLSVKAETDENADEEALTGEDTLAIDTGMPVLTEFGPGTIARVYDASSKMSRLVLVDVPGYGQVRLAKSIVWTATHPNGRAKLGLILRKAGNAGLPKLRADGSSAVYRDPDVNPTTGETDPRTKPTARPPRQVQVYAASLNGMAALNIGAKSEQNPEGVPADLLVGQVDGWRRVGAHLSVKVLHYLGMEALIAFLKKLGSLDAEHEAELKEAATLLRNRAGMLRQTGPVDYTRLRNFYAVDHGPMRAVKGVPLLRPYIMVWDNELWVCFSNRSHPANILTALTRAKQRVGRDAAQYIGDVEQTAPLLINFFRTKAEAGRDLEGLRKLFTVTNYQEAVDGIKSMTLHAPPPKPVEPPKPAAPTGGKRPVPQPPARPAARPAKQAVPQPAPRRR